MLKMVMMVMMLKTGIIVFQELPQTNTVTMLSLTLEDSIEICFVLGTSMRTVTMLSVTLTETATMSQQLGPT